MTTKSSPRVWHLDRDGRLSPRAGKVERRVVVADQDRIDPTADYLFCAPDFLFPADGVARALRLEVDTRATGARKSAPAARAGTGRVAGRGSRWRAAMSPGA